jgi:tetratricopeptide (TPR) repeat protein
VRPQRITLSGPRTSGESYWKRRGWFWGSAVALIGIAAGVYYWTSEDPRTYHEQAQALLDQDPAKAEQLAALAVMKAGGNFPEAQLLQSRALAATGQWAEALGGFAMIKDTTRCDPALLLDLGQHAFSSGEWKLAEMALQAAARSPGPAQSPALERLVELQLKFDLTDEALAQCRAWQRTIPDAALPWAISGDIEASRMNLGAAIADYREALKRSPSPAIEAKVRPSLAQLFVHTGDAAAARIQFDHLMKSGPLTGKNQLSHVQLLRLEGRTDEGLAEIDKYLATEPATAEALKWRGILRFDAGRLDDALDDLKRSVELGPFDIAARHKLAQLYIQSGNAKAAQPHLEKARQMSDAADRIPELQSRLRADPENSDLLRELKKMMSLVGR